MSKIRVAFFADVLVRDFDGATRTMYQIIDRIDRTKFDFIFFCGMPPIRNIGHEIFHVPTLTIPFNRTYKMASMFGMGPRIKSRLNLFHPDVIHITTPSPIGYFALKYGRARGIPVVSIYHTHFMSYIKYYTKGTPLLTEALQGALVLHNRSFYNRCDKIYIPGKEMIKELADKGFDTSNMVVWERGLDEKVFNPGKRSEELRQQLLPPGRKGVLFASRLVWEKNLKVLIRIYRYCLEQKRPFHFVVAGDGVARQELQIQMPEATFLGNVTHEKLSEVYASMDCFLFPSDTETYGNVVAEAMASGLPVICANGGGVKDLVDNGNSGFLCTPDHAEEYVHCMEKVLFEENVRKRIVAKALESVTKRKWSSLVARYFKDIEVLSRSQKEQVIGDHEENFHGI